MVQYLESSCGNFEIDSMANREPVQAGQNWRDVAVCVCAYILTIRHCNLITAPVLRCVVESVL